MTHTPQSTAEVEVPYMREMGRWCVWWTTEKESGESQEKIEGTISLYTLYCVVPAGYRVFSGVFFLSYEFSLHARGRICSSLVFSCTFLAALVQNKKWHYRAEYFKEINQIKAKLCSYESKPASVFYDHDRAEKLFVFLKWSPYF